MRFPTPKEYHLHEVTYAPPPRVANNFRCQIPMDQQIREYARSNRTDLSVVIRHAMHEYLEKRGMSPYLPLGTN